MRLEIDVIRTIEECGLAAWPAVERVRRHGWELRYSGGRSRRANAATPVEPAWSFDAVRAETERFYAQRGQAAVFRITPHAPPEADAALEAAGYTREDSNVVMTRGLVRPVADPGAEVQFEGTAEAGWREGSAGAQGLTPDEVQARDGIVARITPAATFVTVRPDTGNAPPLGYGLGVVENGWVGLFAVVTAPQARRQGAGRRLVRALLWWGQMRGAGHAYLQVGADNEAALALYRQEGFEDAYRYHYRRR